MKENTRWQGQVNDFCKLSKSSKLIFLGVYLWSNSLEKYREFIANMNILNMKNKNQIGKRAVPEKRRKTQNERGKLIFLWVCLYMRVVTYLRNAGKSSQTVSQPGHLHMPWAYRGWVLGDDMALSVSLGILEMSGKWNKMYNWPLNMSIQLKGCWPYFGPDIIIHYVFYSRWKGIIRTV